MSNTIRSTCPRESVLANHNGDSMKEDRSAKHDQPQWDMGVEFYRTNGTKVECFAKLQDFPMVHIRGKMLPDRSRVFVKVVAPFRSTSQIRVPGGASVHVVNDALEKTEDGRHVLIMAKTRKLGDFGEDPK